MTDTWGHVARTALDIYLGNGSTSNADWAGNVANFVGDFGAGLGGSTMAGGNGKVTVDTKTGKVTKCGRRRRRRLLTPTDLNDLAALKTIVGGGQAMNFAVMKAVRR